MKEYSDKSSRGMKVVTLAGFAFAGSLIMIPMLGTWYTVDQGERAVVLRNGALLHVSEPGFHGKLPIVDDVEKISIRELVSTVNADSYSRDQQPAQIEVTVNWRIREGEVARVYTEFGGAAGLNSRLIEARVPQAVRVAFSGFTAERSISERSKLNAEIAEKTRDAVGADLIEIQSVQASINFSEAYEASIEKRMLAEVQVTEVRQNAEREKINAEITVTKARAEADSRMAMAEADAKATRLRGEAEAVAIDAKGRALRDNPQLVGLVSAERWDGKLPSTMLPGGAVPFVSLDK